MLKIVMFVFWQFVNLVVNNYFGNDDDNKTNYDDDDGTNLNLKRIKTF